MAMETICRICRKLFKPTATAMLSGSWRARGGRLVLAGGWTGQASVAVRANDQGTGSGRVGASRRHRAPTRREGTGDGGATPMRTKPDKTGPYRWARDRARAAWLLAEDAKPDADIVVDVGVARSTLSSLTRL